MKHTLKFKDYGRWRNNPGGEVLEFNAGDVFEEATDFLMNLAVSSGRAEMILPEPEPEPEPKKFGRKKKSEKNPAMKDKQDSEYQGD